MTTILSVITRISYRNAKASLLLQSPAACIVLVNPIANTANKAIAKIESFVFMLDFIRTIIPMFLLIWFSCNNNRFYNILFHD